MRRDLNIYGTLGPSCADKGIIKEMLRSGMTGIRLNLSHCTLPEREDWLNEFYAACDEMRMLPDFLVDLQGPELRVGKTEQPLILDDNQTVLLTESGKSRADEADGGHVKDGQAEDGQAEDGQVITGQFIPVPDILFSYFEKGQTIKLDDGKIRLRIIEMQNKKAQHRYARAVVTAGGCLLPGKSIAIDGVSVPLPALTKQDRDMIRLFRRYRVTGVMQPFVRNKKDLITLRQELLSAGMDYVKIYAKIETREGVESVTDFLPYCDEVIIARGDLGNAIPLSELPVVQKQLSAVCRIARKPFMVVTQMLASMEQSRIPTRAEASDIANAILDGAASIMLTGETAAGKYPAEAMQFFCDTAYEALRYREIGDRSLSPFFS